MPTDNKNNKCWDGIERRQQLSESTGIPIPILDHMDRKIDELKSDINMMLSKHTDGEQYVYDAIKSDIRRIEEKVEENKVASDERHQNLMMSIHSYMEKQNQYYDKIDKAFPEGPERHGDDHVKWITERKKRQEFRDKIIEELAKKGIWAFIVGIGLLVWYGLTSKIGGK